MNNIRQVQTLNKRELEHAVPPEASWHADYRDTAFIYIGSLPYDLSEGDILTIFSQFGEPVHLNLVRDKDTGKSRGFAFLKYEDQRSTDLAVDNLGGASVMGRMLSVDHVRYKRREEEGVEDNVRPEAIGGAEKGENIPIGNGEGGEGERRRRKKIRGPKKEDGSEDEEKNVMKRLMLEEEKKLERLIRDHDEEDPMKEYLIKEKKEEVAQAIERAEKKGKASAKHRDEAKERSHRHHRHDHRRHHKRKHSGDRSPSRERRSHKNRSRSRSTERRPHRERRDRDR